MIDTTKIAFMHLLFLGTQAAYMYLANKALLKSQKYLYLAAIPVVMAVPALIYHLNPGTYDIYEYAVIFCMIAAAVVDVVLAGFFDRDYMNGDRFFEYLCAYLMICTVTALLAKASLMFIFIAVIALAVAGFMGFSLKKLSMKGLLSGAALAAVSLLCAWAFVDFVL